MKFAIGEKLWEYSDGIRAYARGPKGDYNVRVFAAQFQPRWILAVEGGEYIVTWIKGSDRRNSYPVERDVAEARYMTDAERGRVVADNEYRARVIDAVVCADLETLRRVEAAIDDRDV